MKGPDGAIDWDATREQARKLDRPTLRAVIAGIGSELDELDDIDRVAGTCAGGIARDEISVYRAELVRVERGRCCPGCGRLED